MTLIGFEWNKFFKSRFPRALNSFNVPKFFGDYCYFRIMFNLENQQTKTRDKSPSLFSPWKKGGNHLFATVSLEKHLEWICTEFLNLVFGESSALVCVWTWSSESSHIRMQHVDSLPISDVRFTFSCFFKSYYYWYDCSYSGIDGTLISRVQFPICLKHCAGTINSQWGLAYRAVFTKCKLICPIESPLTFSPFLRTRSLLCRQTATTQPV